MKRHYFYLIGIILVLSIINLPYSDSYIPPTRAIQRIITSNDTVAAINYSMPITFSGSGVTITGSNSSKTIYFAVAGGGNMTNLNDGGDIVITSPQDNDFLRYDSTSLQWKNEAVAAASGITSVSNAGSGTIQLVFENGTSFARIKSINGVSGNITVTNGTDTATINLGSNVLVLNSKVADLSDVANGCTNGQILEFQTSNSTWICANDDSGSGTAREELVAIWGLDVTMTNIGTSRNMVYDTANSNGEGIRIDTNGKTTITFQVMWTKAGSGTQDCMITDINGAGGQLIVINNIVSGLNVNATADIPTAFENSIKTYRPECLSSTAGDDPVWLSGQVLLR